MSKKIAIIASLIAATAIAASPWQLLRSMVPAALHVWSTGDRPRATDLNGNFSFLNTTKVGGGVQATNSDIASSAAISHSKLSTPALLPKAWAVVTTNCTGSTAANTSCAASDSSQLSINTSGTSGVFRGVLSYTPANANFVVIVTARTATSVCTANATATTSPHFLINCFDYAGAAVDVNQFSVLVMDS